MSVLIRDMKRPIGCSCCKLADHDYDDNCNYIRKHNKCPMTEIPVPHGRLIDADALVEDLKRQCEEVFKIDAVSPDDFWITRDEAYNERLWKTWCELFVEYLKTRETVIPAEEGEG